MAGRKTQLCLFSSFFLPLKRSHQCFLGNDFFFSFRASESSDGLDQCLDSGRADVLPSICLNCHLTFGSSSSYVAPADRVWNVYSTCIGFCVKPYLLLPEPYVCLLNPLEQSFLKCVRRGKKKRKKRFSWAAFLDERTSVYKEDTVEAPCFICLI